MLGDLLFSFVGRTKRIPYLFAILCVVAAAMGILVLQQKIGDWKFANIFIFTLAVLPVVMYLAATSKRFTDRGRFALIGFFIHYIMPVGIVFGAQQILGEPIINPETFADTLKALPEKTDWTTPDIVRWGSLGLAALLFISGQMSLFLRGSKNPEAA